MNSKLADVTIIIKQWYANLVNRWFSMMICILRPVPFLTWNWNLKQWNMYKPLCHCRIPWMVVGDQLRWTRKLGEDIPRVRSMILTLTRTGRDVCFVTQFPYMYFDLHLSYDKKCVNKNSPKPIKKSFWIWVTKFAGFSGTNLRAPSLQTNLIKKGSTLSDTELSSICKTRYLAKSLTSSFKWLWLPRFICWSSSETDSSKILDTLMQSKWWDFLEFFSIKLGCDQIQSSIRTGPCLYYPTKSLI